MAVATELARALAAAAAPRPWWRGRIGLVVAIVARDGDLVLRLEGRLPVARVRSPGTRSTGYLDNFQTWLSDQRNVPDPSVFFTIFNGFATFLDDLVSWLTSFFFRLTWVGTAAFGIARRAALRRPARGARRRGAFASFALMGLWEESVQTLRADDSRPSRSRC